MQGPQCHSTLKTGVVLGNCDLCKLQIFTHKTPLVHYPQCSHIVHLSCFMERSLFVHMGDACFNCLIENRTEKHEKKINNTHVSAVSHEIRKVISPPVTLPPVYPPEWQCSVMNYYTTMVACQNHNVTNKIGKVASDKGNWILVDEMVKSCLRKSMQTQYYSLVNVTQSNEAYWTRASEIKNRLVDFICRVNGDYKNNIKLVTTRMREEQSKSRLEGDQIRGVSSLSVPHEVYGIEPWIVDENENFVKIGIRIQRGERVDPAELRQKEFTAPNFLEINVRLKRLIYRSRYTLQELIDIGLSWQALLALGLRLDLFDDNELSLRKFKLGFPWLTVYHLLLMESSKRTPAEKMGLFCSRPMDEHLLEDLHFDFSVHSALLSPNDVLNLTKSTSVVTMIQSLNLTKQIMDQIGLTNRHFFSEAGWLDDLEFITSSTELTHHDIFQHNNLEPNSFSDNLESEENDDNIENNDLHTDVVAPLMNIQVPRNPRVSYLPLGPSVSSNYLSDTGDYSSTGEGSETDFVRTLLHGGDLIRSQRKTFQSGLRQQKT